MKPSLYEIPVEAEGRLFIMPKPSGDWLSDDISALKLEGIERLVSMLEGDEARELGLDEEAARCTEHGLLFDYFAIVDRGVPERAAFAEKVRVLSDAVKAGETVAVHCRAGIGRSGLMCACILIRLGVDPETAIETVSRSRGVAIPDTAEQAAFIRSFNAHR